MTPRIVQFGFAVRFSTRNYWLLNNLHLVLFNPKMGHSRFYPISFSLCHCTSFTYCKSHINYIIDFTWNRQIEMADGSLYCFMLFFYMFLVSQCLYRQVYNIFTVSCKNHCIPGSSEENILFYSSTARWSCLYVAWPNQQDLLMSSCFGGLTYTISFA
jgi:hypothetical protein